jgi:MOSC domain-containing protein YiiM
VAWIKRITHTPADVERRPADHYARVALDRAILLENHGIEGDAKAGKGRRQLNVMRAETVGQLAAEGFRTAPGELGEQLVLAGLEEAALAPGARLLLGETAVIEVTSPRTPCERFSHIQGKPISAADGRLGVMARVVRGGEIRVGAEVRLALPEGRTDRSHQDG